MKPIKKNKKYESFSQIDGKKLSLLEKKNARVYPRYFEENRTTNGKKYLKNNWYIEANIGGEITTFDKSLGTGAKLKLENFDSQLVATLEYFYKRLK